MLLVTGLLLLVVALLRLADVLGADFLEGGDTLVWGNLPPGAMTWTSLLLAGAAGAAAFARRSAIALLIAALALGFAVLAAAPWIFGADSQGPYRFLLLALAVASVLGSLVLRGSEPRARRAADQRRRRRDPRDPAAGARGRAAAAAEPVRRLAGRACCRTSGSSSCSPPAAAWSPTARSTACPAPPSSASPTCRVHRRGRGRAPSETLLWWPLLLILLGGGALAAGLRPRAPLPPEPDPYRAGEQPLAARADEEITLRVRDDSPPD